MPGLVPLVDDEVALRVGTGTPVTADPPVYAFADSLTPAEVRAWTQNERFWTPAGAAWPFALVPGEPPLELAWAKLEGTLRADDPVPLSGTLEGCFTPQSAGQVQIAALGMSLREVLRSCGTPVDCSTTGDSGFDGWRLRVDWEADVVAVTDAAR